jgi:RNA polymerase sigma-70 factor (ECF subfamily)
MPTANTLDALYRTHAPSVFRRARRLLGSDAEAQEVVQDVFMSLFERPEQYAGKSQMTTFLYSAGTHACLNRIRDAKNRLRLLRERVAGEPQANSDAGLTPEKLSLLHRMLERMPEELARAAVYYYVDDLSHDEVAMLVGCSRRQVGNLLKRLEEWGRAQELSHVDE